MLAVGTFSGSIIRDPNNRIQWLTDNRLKLTSSNSTCLYWLTKKELFYHKILLLLLLLFFAICLPKKHLRVLRNVCPCVPSLPGRRSWGFVTRSCPTFVGGGLRDEPKEGLRGRLVRSRSNWNLEVLIFEERGKTEYQE